MLLIDDLLFGGLRFVLDKLAMVVDRELNDEDALRQTLLESQLAVELGELSEEEFAEREAAILDRLRILRDARTAADEDEDGDVRISGVDVSFGGDDDEGSR